MLCVWRVRVCLISTHTCPAMLLLRIVVPAQCCVCVSVVPGDRHAKERAHDVKNNTPFKLASSDRHTIRWSCRDIVELHAMFVLARFSEKIRRVFSPLWSQVYAPDTTTVYDERS